MASSLSSQTGRKSAALWIAAGLAILLAAQMVEGIPVATSMSLVAWGAVRLAMARPHGGKLAVVNLAIYVLLVGFAIASQLHSVQHSEKRMSLLMLADHALAIVLLIGLAVDTLSRTVAQLSDER